MFSAISASTVLSGTGYVIGDILTVSGGTLTQVTLFKVTQVDSNGAVLAVAVLVIGAYTVIPSNPASTTGGTGTGCTLLITWTSTPLTPSSTTPPVARTTAALVSGIILVQDGVDITPFISVANQMTTDICTYPQPGQDASLFLPYTDGFIGSKMELIERWLSAHFYTIFDNQLSHAKAGTVSVGFQYKIDLGLKVSLYGQQVLRLDTYGGLAALDNVVNAKRQIKVSINWLGHKPSCCLGWEIPAAQV